MSFKLAMVGAGHMACEYVYQWLDENKLKVAAIVDIDPDCAEKLAARISELTGNKPAVYGSVESLVAGKVLALDGAYIATPHVFHARQAALLLRSGVSVLLEKPMATTTAEAETLLRTCDETRASLVIAFQGGLSEVVKKTRDESKAGTYGRLQSVSGCIWENWRQRYQSSWKQIPAIAGGGFMFDTGAHMLNTISIIVDSAVESLAAYKTNLGLELDVISVASGRFANQVLFSVNASGDTQVPICDSQLSFFFERAIVRLDAWGRWREVETAIATQREVIQDGDQIFDTFLKICAGEIENFSDAAQGVRFAQLWDALQGSAAGGEPVSLVAASKDAGRMREGAD